MSCLASSFAALFLPRLLFGLYSISFYSVQVAALAAPPPILIKVLLIGLETASSMSCSSSASSFKSDSLLASSICSLIFLALGEVLSIGPFRET